MTILQSAQGLSPLRLAKPFTSMQRLPIALAKAYGSVPTLITSSRLPMERSMGCCFATHLNRWGRSVQEWFGTAEAGFSMLTVIWAIDRIFQTRLPFRRL